ncbi:MAG: hypothetical protein HN370_03420 [Phycisphaerales bacterium]|jgi:predicted aspartyl protease|nr:hypothetical protein [Phycisphaerales bacterium]
MKLKRLIPIIVALGSSSVLVAAETATKAATDLTDYQPQELTANGPMRTWAILFLFLVGALLPLLKSFRLEAR